MGLNYKVLMWIGLGLGQASKAQDASLPIKTDGSEIGIAIMGTIIQSKSDDNVALVKESSGRVLALKRGLSTSTNFVVVSINAKYLEVKNETGKVYWVYRDKFAMNDSKSTASTPKPQDKESIIIREEGFERKDNAIKMTEAYRDKIVREDLSKVLMQATVEPFFENGQIVGFLISQIDEGSIYQKSGILNGDIITRINEQELNSIANSVKLLQSLKGAKQIEVDLKRAGVPIKIKLEIN